MAQFKEEYDPQQPEMFEDDVYEHAIRQAAGKARLELETRFRELGAKAGGRAFDQLMQAVHSAVEQELPPDIETMGREVDESDAYHELCTDIAQAFMEGFESTWISPFLDYNSEGDKPSQDVV
jgi:hypothetical protein